MKNYIIYAIGEIILVMIGILLALQVNNWNEERKENAIEEEYLIALEKEFEANEDKLNQFITINEDIINTTKEILRHTGPNSQLPISEDEVNSLLTDLIKLNVEYEPSPGILEDLISSGNLNKLSNTTLRKQLSNWKAQLAQVRRQENTVLEYRANIKNLLIEIGDTRNPVAEILMIEKSSFDNENVQLLKDKRMENNLSFFAISSSSLAHQYYGALDILIKDILNTVRDQLDD
ncbi:MAG: hypothetical protein HKN68_22655 [Saprospiraceae bacterium]|nr:hypothetical protein [Saprospiraceae bacterium]